MIISINTLNLLEGNKFKPWNMFLPFLSDKIVIERAKILKKEFEKYGLLFSENLFGVSGHPSKINNLKYISKYLTECNISMTSVDAPDIVFFWDKQMRDDFWKGNLMRIAVHIVWRCYNVQSRKEYKEKMEIALKAHSIVFADIGTSGKVSSKRILRTNSASFTSRKDLGEGDVLKKIMKEKPDMFMSVEIEGEHFDKMEDFYTLIRDLGIQFPNRVGISYDPGHVLIMHHRGKCDTPEKEFEKLLNSDLPIFSFEIDQAKYNPEARKEDEKVELHTLPWDGDIDMKGMIKRYLSTTLPRNIQQHLVLEVSPIYWDGFISKIGKYLKDVII